MKKGLKKFLPAFLKAFLSKEYAKYCFYHQKESVSDHIQDQIKRIKKSESTPILFGGYMKSGNTWLRFLIYNYFNILKNNADVTLSYTELNTIQHDTIGDNQVLKGSSPGFPYVIRTHRHNSSVFDVFEKCIYIYRNPLDTLVSEYHFRKDHEEMGIHNTEEVDIDVFVRQHIVFWEMHVQSYLQKKNVLIVRYEDLQRDALEELRKIIIYLSYEFNEEAGRKSVEFSTFQNIKKMGRDQNQKYGNGGIRFKGEFARKGKVGGYFEELKKDTIKKAYSLFKKYGF